jgi:hypothetical protein
MGSQRMFKKQGCNRFCQHAWLAAQHCVLQGLGISTVELAAAHIWHHQEQCSSQCLSCKTMSEEGSGPSPTSADSEHQQRNLVTL